VDVQLASAGVVRTPTLDAQGGTYGSLTITPGRDEDGAVICVCARWDGGAKPTGLDPR